MTPCCPQSTWSCCCSSFHFCLRLWNPDLFTGRATLSQTCCFQLSLSTAPAISTSKCLAMKSQVKFTPYVLTFCNLYNHCDYYLTLLVIYERLNILEKNLAFMAMLSRIPPRLLLLLVRAGFGIRRPWSTSCYRLMFSMFVWFCLVGAPVSYYVLIMSPISFLWFCLQLCVVVR
ncbi:hypothetical protein J4Q44_G00074190, partial [Coregonus suidteri]